MSVALNSQHLQLDSMSRDLHDKLELEIKASNDEIKGLLEDLLRGRSSK